MGLRQDFEAALQSLKLELITDLHRTDVLKKDKLEALQLEYNQKMVNVQSHFLKMLSSTYPSVSVKFDTPDAANMEDYGKIAFGGAGAAGATGAVLYFITFNVAQTSWIFWSVATPVTLAAWLAGLLGISTTLATAVLTGGVGAIVLAGLYVAFFPVWRRRVRKKLLEDFDVKILPLLRDWRDDVINKAEQFKG